MGTRVRAEGRGWEGEDKSEMIHLSENPDVVGERRGRMFGRFFPGKAAEPESDFTALILQAFQHLLLDLSDSAPSVDRT